MHSDRSSLFRRSGCVLRGSVSPRLIPVAEMIHSVVIFLVHLLFR